MGHVATWEVEKKKGKGNYLIYFQINLILPTSTISNL
jgi:hypothetical protein